MAYRFKLTESFGDGLHRIGHEQIDRALAELDSSPPATAVHEVRKALKRLRALLRLARPGLAKEAYDHGNARFRDIGRMLSGSRDRTVMIATLGRLAHFEPDVAAAAAGLQQALLRDGPAGPAVADGSDDHLSQARKLLGKARREWAALRLEPDAFEPLGEGLGKSLRDCISGLETAYRTGDDAEFHAWRKSIQQHWRHMRLLANAWPAYFEARAAQARELSELLGVAQDLAVLVAYLGSDIGHPVDGRELKALRELARSRQDKLREAARSRAARLFAERPDGFVRRATTYWSTAVAMPESPLEAEPPQPEPPPPAKAAKPGRSTASARSHRKPSSRRRKLAPARD